MRRRTNKVLAAIMAAAMLLSQSGGALSVIAEEVPEETVVAQEAAAELYEEPSGEEFQEEASAEGENTMEEAQEVPDPALEAPVTEAPAPEAPVTEAPAPEVPVTEAPVTEAPAPEAPVTEAPVTEAPAPEAPVTEAPVTEAPQTDAPATEAPVTEAPATEAPQTDAPATEAPVTEAPATEAPQTEQQASESDLPADIIETEETEEETEPVSEAMTDMFRCSGEGITIYAQLTGGEMLPQSAYMDVTWLDAARQGAGYNVLLKQELEKGHRSVAGAEFFRIRFMDGEEELRTQNAVHITFQFEQPRNLGLSAYMEAEAVAYLMEPSMQLLTRPGLENDENGTPWLYAAEVEAPSGAVIAFAGVQNHVNAGMELTKGEISEKLGKYLEHPILTNVLNWNDAAAAAVSGLAAGNYTQLVSAGNDMIQPETDVHTYASEEDVSADFAQDAASAAGAGLSGEEIRTMLDELSELSVKLADARGTDDVAVVNLYADETGAIAQAPLKAVLTSDGTHLDVTKKKILVNIVAASQEQALTLPVYPVRDDDPERVNLDESFGYARVLYNVTAWKDGGFAPYKGQATMKEATGGTWILPEGSLTVEKGLLGGAMADQVSMKEQALFQAMPLQTSDGVSTDFISPEDVAPIPDAMPEVVDGGEQLQPDAGEDHAADEDYAKPLVITSATGSWVYDGNAHSMAEYTVTFDGQEVTPDESGSSYVLPGTGDKLTLTVIEAVAPEVKDYTEKPVENTIDGVVAITITDPEDSEKSVIGQYSDIRLVNGTLTVTKRPLTVTGIADTTKVYNGTEQSVEVTGDAIVAGTGENEGLVEGHTHNIASCTAKGTNAGNYAGEFSYAHGEQAETEMIIRDADGNVVTENYEVSLQSGELTIAQRPVTFTGETATKEYTGSEIELTGVTVSSGENEGLIEGHTVTPAITYSAKGTAAGTYQGAFTGPDGAKITDAAGNDVTANYNPTLTAGKLTITPKAGGTVTITVKSWLGSTQDKAFTEAAVYQLADSEGNVLKSSEGAIETLTNKTGEVKWTFDPTQYGLFKQELGTKETVDLKILGQVPEGYYANRAEYPIKIGRDKNGNVKVNKTAAHFFYRELLTTFTVNVSAEVKNSSSKTGYDYLAAEFTLKDENGKAIANADKEPLTVSVTTEGATALVIDPENYPELAKGLADGKEITLTLEETTSPDGYFVNPTKQLVLWKDTYGNVRVRRSTATKAATGNVLNFRYIHKLLRTYLTIQAVDKDDTKSPLPGAAYAVRMSDGTPLKIICLNSDGDAKLMTVAPTLGTSKKSLAHLAVIDLRRNETLKAILEEKGKAELTVSELTPPTGNTKGKAASYKVYGSPDYKVTLTYNKQTGSLTFDKSKVLMLNEKRSADETTTSDSIQVVKKQYYGNAAITMGEKATYYFALFSDAKRKNRVSEVRTILFARGGVTTASTTFTGLQPGTYYVGETDRFGNLVGRQKKQKKAKDPFYVEYDDEDVEIAGTTNRTYTVTAANHFFELPDGASYYAELTVQKQLKDDKGADKASAGEFYFYIYSENGQYPLGTREENGQIVRPTPYVIAMNGASIGERTMALPMAEDSRTLRIRETDKNGVLLKTGENYKITYSNENGAVTLTRDQQQPAVLTITNQEISEEEKNAAKTATLTLTKKVTYKGTPMRVNAAYYIGIFKSADIKKENLLGTVSASVRALALRNASEASTKPITVRLDRVASREVTLYFAETDREGNPVQSGTKTGYNISINGQAGNYAKVTLNSKNPKAEVVVTNDILSGGVQERRLLNSSSGFAGDRSALAEAQEIENDTTAGVASNTGDETPILPLVGILGGSAAVILIAVLVLLRRRKNRK